MFYIIFLYITQSLIEVTVLQAMVFKNFDKFSFVLHFSTLKLLFSFRKSLRFQRTYFETVRFFPEMCVKNAKRRQKIITDCTTIYSPQHGVSYGPSPTRHSRCRSTAQSDTATGFSPGSHNFHISLTGTQENVTIFYIIENMRSCTEMHKTFYNIVKLYIGLTVCYNFSFLILTPKLIKMLLIVHEEAE